MTFERLSAMLVASVLSIGGCKNSEPATDATVHPEQAPADSGSAGPSIHSLTMKRLDGTETSLATFAGKVLLVVNTASECGYTPQYEGLQALHAKYEGRGFAVLGFPSNDFGGQEPGGAPEIATFCKTRFGVTFPMFEKVKTIGSGRSELYTILATAKGEPKWNFHKYLVDKRGVTVKAWPSATSPASSEIAEAIEQALAAP